MYESKGFSLLKAKENEQPRLALSFEKISRITSDEKSSNAYQVKIFLQKRGQLWKYFSFRRGGKLIKYIWTRLDWQIKITLLKNEMDFFVEDCPIRSECWGTATEAIYRWRRRVYTYLGCGNVKTSKMFSCSLFWPFFPSKFSLNIYSFLITFIKTIDDSFNYFNNLLYMAIFFCIIGFFLETYSFDEN